MVSIINIFLISGLFSCLFLCAFFDFLYYRIPNFFSVCIFALFLIYVLSNHRYELFSNFYLFLITFVIGYFLFYANIMGGGDVKLFSVLSLWIGWAHIVEVILWTSIFGAIIALFIVSFPLKIKKIRKYLYSISFIQAISRKLLDNLNNIEKEATSKKSTRMVPYGIAIVIAYLVFYWKAKFLWL